MSEETTPSSSTSSLRPRLRLLHPQDAEQGVRVTLLLLPACERKALPRETIWSSLFNNHVPITRRQSAGDQVCRRSIPDPQETRWRTAVGLRSYGGLSTPSAVRRPGSLPIGRSKGSDIDLSPRKDKRDPSRNVPRRSEGDGGPPTVVRVVPAVPGRHGDTAWADRRAHPHIRAGAGLGGLSQRHSRGRGRGRHHPDGHAAELDPGDHKRRVAGARGRRSLRDVPDGGRNPNFRAYSTNFRPRPRL